MTEKEQDYPFARKVGNITGSVLVVILGATFVAAALMAAWKVLMWMA